MSTKDGMDPVVSALMRGIVTVGAEAWAVKGIAEPSAMRLDTTVRQPAWKTYFRSLTSVRKRTPKCAKRQSRWTRISRDFQGDIDAHPTCVGHPQP